MIVSAPRPGHQDMHQLSLPARSPSALAQPSLGFGVSEKEARGEGAGSGPCRPTPSPWQAGGSRATWHPGRPGELGQLRPPSLPVLVRNKSKINYSCLFPFPSKNRCPSFVLCPLLSFIKLTVCDGNPTWQQPDGGRLPTPVRIFTVAAVAERSPPARQRGLWLGW